MNDELASQEQLLRDARSRGTGATLRAFMRLSGPGWLQSAITLGGGSLASALYLGVLSGYRMLWVQVLAMLFGVVMLAAIANVTLSTGERPFGSICRHVNPVLGWGWLVAVILANIVWAMPQFALGTAALQQNLVPAIGEGTGGTLACCALILGLATAVIWSYDSGRRGVRVFEGILKGMVGLIVVCFFGVVGTLAFSGEGLAWGGILGGLVPDLSMLSRPVPAFDALLAETPAASWWSRRIVSQQQDVMIAAAATAVGINMTFLLPYSMLRRGWNHHFRGLATFDLGTGLLVPFAIATGCVVIAAASQFHTRFDEELLRDPAAAASNAPFLRTLDARLQHAYDEGGDAQALEFGETFESASVAPDLAKELGPEAFEERVRRAQARLPHADLALSATLLKRDAFDLADALAPLSGRGLAQIVFGIGVLGMAVSTVIVLMLISGFALCEAFGAEPRGAAHRAGALVAGGLGVLGPFIWTGQAKVWLAVPTSNVGMMLLPIAYWTFFLMMNSASLLGDQRPRGTRRTLWNTAMLAAAGVATFASLYTIDKKLGWRGWAGVAAFLVLALVVHLRRARARD